MSRSYCKPNVINATDRMRNAEEEIERLKSNSKAKDNSEELQNIHNEIDALKEIISRLGGSGKVKYMGYGEVGSESEKNNNWASWDKFRIVATNYSETSNVTFAVAIGNARVYTWGSNGDDTHCGQLDVSLGSDFSTYILKGTSTNVNEQWVTIGESQYNQIHFIAEGETATERHIVLCDQATSGIKLEDDSGTYKLITNKTAVDCGDSLRNGDQKPCFYTDMSFYVVSIIND